MVVFSLIADAKDLYLLNFVDPAEPTAQSRTP
jgi:hypothetical protein